MQDLLELTPELLLEQSQEMLRLKNEYATLFEGMGTDLNGINESWSDLMSHNFSSKIITAQKSFTGALGMLQNSGSKAALVANTLLEFDTSRAARISGLATSIGGSNSPQFYGGMTPNITPQLMEQLEEMIADGKNDGKELMNFLNGLDDKMQEKLPSSVTAWGELLMGKALGDYKDAAKITKCLLEGDYMGALEELGEAGMGLLFEGDPNAKLLCTYWTSFIRDTAGSGTELVLEPSLENLCKVGWNLTAQPILDTAGKLSSKVAKLIPGISEYYYETGDETPGDVWTKVLGDAYGVFNGDPEGSREYVAEFYEDGIFEGLWDGFTEIGDFVSDYGVVETGKVLIDGVAEDLSTAWETISNITWHSVF